MKFNRHQLLIPSLLTTLCLSPMAFAQRSTVKTTKTVKKKTVGELLSQASESSRGGRLQMSKTDTSLPASNLGFKQDVRSYNLESVKPPRSSELMQHESSGASSEQAQYERVLDQQIQELYKLTQKFKTSPNRGELWLRLAELYVEKASLIDSRKQDEYDAKLRAFQSGKTKKKPRLDTADAREYNKKAVQLYEWFQRDFPRDEKNSQALFFLGYNYFELGEVKKGAQYYEQLTRGYPNSPFVGEAHFALAEYYFENEKWAPAYKEYSYLIKEKKHRLHTFALYKGAWCLFRIGKVQQAMNYLEFIIKSGKAETGDQLAGRRTVNRTRLEGEALRDIVIFYAEGGDPNKAASYFKNLVGNDYLPYLEKLAYQYSDRGNKDASRDVFKLLISQAPTAPKAFEYQYQIVQNYYYAKNTSRFKTELYSWVKDYDASGAWYAANKNNKELIENSYKLRETTLRNYVLQQHQTAQNSRAPYSQSLANEGYQLYLREFPDSASAGDMHFYYGELLYDMQKYDEASVQYKWVVDNAPQSKFYGKSAQNLILSVERSIPSDQEMQKRVGNSLDPVPLEPKVDRFIKAGQWYIEKFPTSEKAVEIKFRIGRLYYQSNHFDEATKHFREIVQQHPNTKYAEYSANLLLDIYNLKKDYVGLEKTGAELLAVPSIAASKAGSDIRGVLEKASFKRGQDLELEKKYADSAQVYQAFAKQNPKSNLATTALFNAGVNFERAGMNGPAIESYQGVIDSKDPSAEKLKPKARRLLAKQYQDSAQFEEAAKLYKQSAQENPTDPLAPNLIFNAAVLYEALGKSDEAIRAYTEFTKLNKKHADNIEAVFSMAQIHRKAGQNGAAIARYTEYVENGGRDQEKVVEAAYWVSELSERSRAKTKADEWKQKTLSIQKRFAPNRKGVGASWAAKLKFGEAQETFKEMKAITFPADPNKQKAAADKKIALLTKLTGELADIIKYDSAEEIVSSLSVLGEANQNMAQAIVNAPLPPGLNAEETKQYKAGVEKFAEPFNTKAKESFKLAVERGWELEVYNDGFKTAYEYMNKLDPKTYYNGGEVGSDIRLVNWMGQ
ncbi:adventurous gliding motility protein U [Bdellovibrio bacteriovorus]|uniref:Adventurous gliding motility protein U n=1 Tax=Bdellovibrio bacteriovorus TaxID=959 RepID=A0A150WJ13_BDEBC|nr:tetratricopeptide repeat protein [Bdellovibrio bacteriovorus]KYG63479.1 adventurous gliding motility protein U [Bdellovibrio bacteriovorus]